MLKRSTSEEEKAKLEALVRGVVDPVLFARLGDLELISDISIGRSALDVGLRVPIPDYPGEPRIEEALTEAFSPLGFSVRLRPEVMGDDERESLGLRLKALDGPVSPKGSPGGDPHGATARDNQFATRKSATRVLAISSGKGGVGKSSVTVNLAVALARSGHTVGLLDADIYGFSVPRMIGVPYAPIVLGHTIVPPVAHGVRCISMGFFVDEDQAVAWRGPMLHKALEQFLVDVYWGAPEYLLIDMPPGTGDVALSIAQQLPTAELYVVTTPQASAGRIAQRSGSLAKQLRLPVRGVIENMSWFEAPGGSRHEIFGAGGGDLLAKSFGVPLLAQVPLVERVREAADLGEPVAIADPDGPVTPIFDQLAEKIAGLGPARVYRSELSIS